MNKNTKMNFEVFAHLDKDYAFLCSVNEDRSATRKLLINNVTYKAFTENLPVDEKVMLRANINSLYTIMNKESITEIDRACVIDIANRLESKFDNIRVDDYSHLNNPVDDLQSDMDELNIDNVKDATEWILVEKETGYIIAYITDDTDDETYDMIISDGDDCITYLEEKYEDDSIGMVLKNSMDQFNINEFDSSLEAFDGIRELQDSLKFISDISTVIKSADIGNWESFVDEDDMVFDKYMHIALYSLEQSICLGQIFIEKVDSLTNNIAKMINEETVEYYLNQPDVNISGYKFNEILNELQSNSITTIEEFIESMTEIGILCIMTRDDKECKVFINDEVDYDEDIDDYEDDDEREDKTLEGFLLVRDDTGEIIAKAFVEEDGGYKYSINNVYLVTRQYDNVPGVELSQAINKCNVDKVDLYEMSKAVSGVMGDIELTLEPISQYDDTVGICISKYIEFLVMDKDSRDTVGQLRFSVLDPVFHGNGKVSVSQVIIKTPNVDAKKSMLVKPTFDKFSGVMSMEDVDLNMIMSSLSQLELFDIIINNGGDEYLIITDVIEYIGASQIIDSNNGPIFSLDATSTDVSGNGRFYGEADHPTNQSTSGKIGHIRTSKKGTGITFKDVIGMTEVKEKLYDVIDQMNNKDKYIEWDIKPIRGVLLHGPSGTGKSYISEALANEVDAKFIKKSAGDIMSKYIGESGQNIKKIFDEARSAKGNSIIFIDEIDAIASKRSGDDNNKERNSTLNELLVQMSSPDNDNIFMIFATNLHEILDPAFLRSGRCDFKIEVPLPDFEMRKGILESTSKKRPLADDVDLESVARNMSGMNCADVSHLSNEAARIALKAKKDKIESVDYEKAYEDMICGSSSKTTKLEDDEKRMTAIHEIGHYFMNHKLNLRKAKKISILPRGSALGFVLYANEDKNDKFISTAKDLEGQIMTLLAGRASEEIMLGYAGTGASNDLERANEIARNIVCKYAFNGSLVVYDSNDIMSRPAINEQVAEILNDCYNEVKNALSANKDLVKELADFLYDKEDVTGDELDAVISSFYEKIAVSQQ